MQAERLDGLDGLKVFVVEDESLVAMQLEDMLCDFGCEIAGLAMRIARAEEMLKGGLEVDMAVLDVNISGEKVYPIAEMLRDRGVPIVFATGYGRGGVEACWHTCPILQKPYTADQVEQTIRAALS